MARKVHITPEAESDLRFIGDYIVSQHAPKAARRFIKSLRSQIASLKTFPKGFGQAPEAEAAGVDLRQMMHGLYRVLYTIEGNVVTISCDSPRRSTAAAQRRSAQAEYGWQSRWHRRRLATTIKLCQQMHLALAPRFVVPTMNDAGQ